MWTFAVICCLLWLETVAPKWQPLRARTIFQLTIETLQDVDPDGGQDDTPSPQPVTATEAIDDREHCEREHRQHVDPTRPPSVAGVVRKAPRSHKGRAEPVASCQQAGTATAGLGAGGDQQPDQGEA